MILEQLFDLKAMFKLYLFMFDVVYMQPATSKLPAARSRQPTAKSQQPTVNSQKLAANNLQPIGPRTQSPLGLALGANWAWNSGPMWLRAQRPLGLGAKVHGA